ncbi:hypothetical protein K469DRAFT_725204 [Zopfia rhizophila CBS 207.26]|uniref:DUF7896 domain-containing protein n=1 Tax=Zopfia rhizophila CBS 207.26 TaxID=1314779 RepID=A0A6A6E9C2_9PEZI|nr:hypothetical protein K469DRAFT_725204 [Zopfia rhizophila CBS 207.26]
MASNLLQMAKQEFWRSNAHLSEQQLQQLWIQTASSISSDAFVDRQPSPARHVPRTMSYSASRISNTPSQDHSMDRVRSAPATVPMKRSISIHLSTDNTNTNILDQRSLSALPSWQAPFEKSGNDYTYSKSTSDRKRPSLHRIDEASTFSNVHEYSPAEYVSTCIEPSSSSSLSFPLNQDSNRLSVSQLTPISQWSSHDGSTSPSTPISADPMTPVTRTSNEMSRQTSLNTQYLGDVSMLRVDSNCSNVVPILSEDGFPISLPSDVDLKDISMTVDNSHFLTFTGPSSEAFLTPAQFSASASALTSFENQSYLAEDMQRSTSTSNESDASNVSTSSSSSRQSRREREVIAQASRKIAPKASHDDETQSATSSAQMVRIRSQDGSSKDVGVITKTPYVRPTHPKIMCPDCNDHPKGFRGEHELRRHTERAHAAIRKAYICIDASPDKKFLANCKHCRNQKKYGAYYNAAAHLRRAHFNPRKRGLKGKHDEKRGGIGGGDKPPMEELKARWILEVEVKNVPSTQVAPESDSDEANCVNMEFDGSYDASYTSQPSNDAANMLFQHPQSEQQEKRTSTSPHTPVSSSTHLAPKPA